MIHWLVQSATKNSDLARGIAPLGLLHPAEQTRLSMLKLTKRRCEWLLGRSTAKHLLQACIAHDLNLRLPLNAITIYNDAYGAPVAMVDCGARVAEWIISISHSYDNAFCAASCASIGLGADIEHVEPHGPLFVEDYFTRDEIERVRSAPLEMRDTFITAIWSAKEAALKALHLGLTIDTQRITCAIDPTYYPDHGWIEFEIACTRGYTEMLQGWWRMWNGYVLALATTAQ